MGCNCRFRKTVRQSGVAFVPERTMYLDNNATTPVDPRVLGAMDGLCRREWGNPSSLTSCGTQAFDVIEEARKTVAGWLGLDQDGIHFCSSGSEAIHAGLFGTHLRDKSRTIITTAVEHSAVYHPLRHLRAAGNNVVTLPVDDNGAVRMDSLQRALEAAPSSFLLYSPVNHETGAIQPVTEIYRLSRRYDCIVMLDAVQALARLTPGDWAPYCDLLAASGHKVYAPKGIAFLWKKNNVKLRPFRFGGHQEDGLFPGTENSPGIAAMAAAVRLLSEEFHNDEKRLSVLIREGLAALDAAGVTYELESPDNRVAGVACISLPWVKDMEKLSLDLNRSRICISRFSACSARITGPSRILSAMGRTQTRSMTSLRIALGRFNKREDLYLLAKNLAQFQKKA
jgi:cysteine desulfurase